MSLNPTGWMVKTYWNVLEYTWIYMENYCIILLNIWNIYMEYNIIEYILLYNIIELYLWNIYIIISNPEKDWEEIDLSMLPPMFFYI